MTPPASPTYGIKSHRLEKKVFTVSVCPVVQFFHPYTIPVATHSSGPLNNNLLENLRVRCL